MAGAQNGDTVKVHYTGKLDDGTVFDSSRTRDPIEFTLGEQGIITGFQEIVVGMEPGESKTTTVPVEKAYGHRNDEMIVEIPRSRVPEDVNPQIGEHVYLARPDGQTIPVRVVEATDAAITVDANHPLAGEALTFDVELMEIV